MRPRGPATRGGEFTIDAMHEHKGPRTRSPLGAHPVYPIVILASVLLAAVLALVSAPAIAAGVGQASSGEVLFYPCNSCHPVVTGPSGAPVGLPREFEEHQVTLTAHAVLGEGSDACLACHEDPGSDPGQLKLVDGGRVAIGDEDVSRVCFGCHSLRYREWEAGIHGREQPGCTAAGCHDPHTPEWIYGEALLPFTGTGFNVRVTSERLPFTPMGGPPVHAPVVTPEWLVLASVLVLLFCLGIIGFLIAGRSQR